MISNKSVNIPQTNQTNQNTNSLVWEKIDSDGSVERPTAREGHVLVHMPDKNKYLTFGGISNVRFSDIYLLSMDEKKWIHVKPTGEIPKELSHCVGWYDCQLGYFFFHGGRNKELSLSDTYFLDTNEWIWRKVFNMEQPSPRYHHAVAKSEGKEAYIFGGFDEKRNRCLGDLHRYEYKVLKISSNENDKVGGSSWISIHDSGAKPTARKGHKMVYHKNSLILYGGMSNKGLDDDSIYRYTIENRQWKKIEITGTKPGCRVFHTFEFFKPDQLIIFGGKVKSSENPEDYKISNDYIMVDLSNNDCSTPFIANTGPTPRFGHASSFRSYMPNTQVTFESEHVILGGLDQSYCPMDTYVIREMDVKSNDKKWVYEQKKMHSSQVESKDAIFEIAKKTIISYKKQLEQLSSQNIEINRKYSEQFNTLNFYKKSLLEEDLSTNEKKTQQILLKNKIESEKRTLSSEARELKDYNNLLNSELKIQREKFLLLSEFLEESIDDVKIMDEIICSVDKSQNKLLLFANIDLDSLSYKRRNYKLDLENFKTNLKDASLYEKEIYEEIVKLQDEQKAKFKNDYYIGTDDKQVLSFREKKEEVRNLSASQIHNDSLEK